jgi:tetratricopeptide (TPR) repeat protein
MGADEVGTLKGLTERRAILDRFIGEHRGRIANTAGDSVLAEFGSAVDAVQAQTALAEANSMLPPDRRITFRIGIHIGDVMVRSGDLFGDGVNTAARLQSIAKPGTACISGTTYDQVRKVLAMTYVDLGIQTVKNIEEPIKAYQVGTPSETREAAPARVAEPEGFPPLPDKPSIAVLPFENMSGDRDQEYFADGMVEEIITALSRFKAVRSFEGAIRMSPVDPQLHQPLVGIGMALIELGRLDEAIVAEKKARRQSPSYGAAYRCLASVFAHLGRNAEAREAAARLLEVDPKFTIGTWMARGGQTNAKLLIEGRPSESGLARMNPVCPRVPLW